MQRMLLSLTPLLLIFPSPLFAKPPEISAFVRSYVDSYCIECHDAETEKGDRNLEPFLEAPNNPTHLITVEEILDQLNLGEMPPQKKNVKQPALNDTRKVVAELTAYLHHHAAGKQPHTTTLRRLNRIEYRNSIIDLLALDRNIPDPTIDFPDDAREHGFDVIGEALVLSDHQLSQYLKTAEKFLDQAIHFSEKAPPSKRYVVEPKHITGNRSITRAAVTWRLNRDDKFLEIGHGSTIDDSPTYPRGTLRNGVPSDGIYVITLKAEAFNRLTHPYDPKMIPLDRDEPIKLALWNAPERKLLSGTANIGRQRLAVYELPDNEIEEIKIRTWLTKGSTPFISWINGFSSKPIIRRISEKYHFEVLRATDMLKDMAAAGDAKALAIMNQKASAKILSDVYQGPRIRIHGFSIEGPQHDIWPPASHQRIFGTATDPKMIDVATTVQRFANRAFRRPVADADVQHYVDFIAQRSAAGDPPQLAIKLGLAAILASPRFLYLDEGNDDQPHKLSQHELATRLSYFLWSSTPDDELLELANSGKLANPAVLREQVDRLLKDPKAAAFTDRFTDSWLHLNKLGTMPPATRKFPLYYKYRLKSAMAKETRHFFHHILTNNRPITDFLDSDYTFINNGLARLYGIDGITTEEFQQVQLKPEHNRGGLLGQASVLTASANGIETSPVVRGVWILENILGTPPAPPPPDVEPIEPDVRGATTIRQQLEKHRNVTACADCHTKIDPLGFALEYYDPIGTYRKHYGRYRGPKRTHFIDGKGQLPNGDSFTNQVELKKILLDRKDQFARALTEKLIIYSTGRKTTFRDHEAIREIVEKSASDNYGFRDLLHHIIASKPFQNR